jgi:hypothetical protein
MPRMLTVFLAGVITAAMLLMPAARWLGLNPPDWFRPTTTDCSYALSWEGDGAGAGGGRAGVDVSVSRSVCSWTIRSDNPWITLGSSTPDPSRVGAGHVDFDVAENSGERRVGTVTIAYHTFTIDQAGRDGAGACTFSIFPSEATVGPGGGPGAFAVVPSAPDCWWWAEAPAARGDDDLFNRDFHTGIGNGVETYEFVPSTVLPTLPLPRSAEILVSDSRGRTGGGFSLPGSAVARYRVTQTP